MPEVSSLEGEHTYLYLDGIVMKRTWAGEVRNVSLLVASAVNAEGYREDPGHLRGGQGGQVRLIGLPAPLGGPGPFGCAADHLECLPGPGGERR